MNLKINYYYHLLDVFFLGNESAYCLDFDFLINSVKYTDRYCGLYVDVYDQYEDYYSILEKKLKVRV